MDWTESGAWEVAPGVHRIPLPMPAQDGLRAVNVYAIADGDGGLTLVDSWLGTVARRTRALVVSPGPDRRGLGDVATVPGHPLPPRPLHARRRAAGAGWRDGALGAGEQARLDAINLTAGARAARPYFARVDRRGRSRSGRRDVGFDAPPMDLAGVGGPCATECRFSTTDRRLDVGGVWLPGGRDLVAISTPGHTSGHLVFRDGDDGPMFTGDHVLPHITPSIAFEPVSEGLPLGSFLDSAPDHA